MFQLISFFAINYSKNIPIICHYNLSKKVLDDILLKIIFQSLYLMNLWTLLIYMMITIMK